MMKIAVLVLIPAILASPFQSQGCANADPTSHLCPITYTGFHMLCSEYPWGEAQQQCYNAGLRPAVLNDQNSLAALAVVQECLLLGGRRVWVDSFNGLPADPCAYVVAEGAAIFSPGDQLCLNLTLPILCQDIPVEQVTQYDPSPVTTVSGVTTTTTTTCIQCNCQGKGLLPDGKICPACINKSRPTDAPLKASAPQKNCDRRNPSSCSDQHHPPCLDAQGCLPLCPYTVGGLHVIQGNVTYNQAERECSKYGWNLADAYAGIHSEVAFMQNVCGSDDQDHNLWIRSYNGVDGAMCLVALKDDFANVPIGYGLSADYCMEQPLYILCQERSAAITGYGGFDGTISYSTLSLQSPATIFSATATATVTITNYY